MLNRLKFAVINKVRWSDDKSNLVISRKDLCNVLGNFIESSKQANMLITKLLCNDVDNSLTVVGQDTTNVLLKCDVIPILFNAHVLQLQTLIWRQWLNDLAVELSHNAPDAPDIADSPDIAIADAPDIAGAMVTVEQAADTPNTAVVAAGVY